MHARYGFQPGLDMILMLVALSRPLLKLEDGGAPIAAQHLEWEFDPFGSALQTLGPSDEGLTLKFDPLKSAILKPGRAKFDDYLDALAQKDTRKLLEYRVPRAFNFEKALLEIWANEGYIVFCQACRGELPKRELPKFLAQKGETAAQVMEETDHAIWLVNRIMEPKLRPALGGFMIRLVDRKLKNRDETLVISIKQALASQDIESLATAENRILDQIASPEKKKLAETHMWWLREDDFPTDKWSEHWLELWKLAR